MRVARVQRSILSGLCGLVGAAVLAAPGIAGADVSSQLAGYENEARNLSTELPSPQSLVAPDLGSHRLVDAEVSFGLGDYDQAALRLFDFVDKPGPDAEAATYYLAESLYRKGDRGAAHTYFSQLATAAPMTSQYYQPALGRLVELAIASGDDSDADTWIAKFDQIPPGMRQPLVPYVRGKYAYSKGKYDEALAYFQDVPKGGDWYMQAQFYTATIAIAKQDLPRATSMFTDLIDQSPRTANDRRVIELGQLALGRLHYERDEFGKSIDSYLLIDRHSDLFPDALYEVSWVYVKNKQYDKALRALELLERSEPDSSRTPTIRILEGNLRIRKAQLIRSSQIEGTGATADDPNVEYDKANQVFAETHDQYYPGYVALSQMVAQNVDPARFLDQLTGHSDRAFQVIAPLPDDAAAIIRDEPRVHRLLGVDGDLADIRHDLDETRETIARLDAVVASHDKYYVFPVLATRRARIAFVQDALVKLRDDLADQQLALITPSADLAQLTATRKQLSQAYAGTPNVQHAHDDHVAELTASYDAVEHTAAEADQALDQTDAMAVALRLSLNSGKAVPDDQKAAVAQGLADAATESRALTDELADVQRELRLDRELVGFTDDDTGPARDARLKLTQAQDAEHRVLAGFASASHDPGKSQSLASLGDRAGRIADQLDQLDGQIDGIVQQGLAIAKTMLDGERGNVTTLEHDLADATTEANDAAKDVLGASFADARARLYDIVIRTDVGTVDVAWSQKEDNDDDLKRLNLAHSRELKQLRDEFKDILEDNTPKPQEKHKSDLPPPPTGNDSNQRVNAGTGTSSVPASVKPDQTPPTPPKSGTGGSR